MPLGAARISFLAKTQVTAVAEVIRRKVGVSAGGDAQVDTAISKFGGASALFDGASDYLEANGTNSDWNVVVGEPRTFECWVYSDDINDLADTIMSQRTTGSGTVGWRLAMQDSGGTDGELRLVHWNSSNAVTVDAYSTNTLSATTWHHVAYVWDGVDNHSVYIDGTRGINVTETDIASADRPLRIGNEFDSISSRGWDGNIDEFRVSNVAKYSGASFTAPTAPFTNDNNTLLLLHMNGTDGSTLFEDDNGVRAPVGVSAVGNAQVDDAQSKFGGASLYLDGTGDYLDTSLNDTPSGTDQYTIEGWIRRTADSGGYEYYAQKGWADATVANRSWFWGVSNTDKAAFLYSSGTNAISKLGTTSLSVGTWYHVAVSNDGTTTRLFVNGVQENSWTTVNINSGSSYDVRIGANITGTTSNANGHLDEFRISDTARYTSNFSVATAPFVNDANTLLLLHMDSTLDITASTDFVDDNGKGRSKVGLISEDPVLTTADSKFGGSSLNSHFGSGGDRVRVKHTDIWNLPTTGYTLECFVKVKQDYGSTTTHIWAFRTSSSGDGLNLAINASPNNFRVYDANGLSLDIGSSNWSLDTWYHVAVVNDAGTVELFLDGVSQGTYSTYTYQHTQELALCNLSYAGVLGAPAYIDEFRVSDTVRYTGDFTPPTEPFQNDADTLLLLHFDGTDGSSVFIDDNGTYTE